MLQSVCYHADSVGPTNRSVFRTLRGLNLLLIRSQAAIFISTALSLAFVSFGAGWHLSRRTIGSGNPERYLTREGDAEEGVREEVLAPLRTFQDGYSKRDPSILPAFMEQLFPKDRDILVLGTDQGEWIEGYQRVAEFIGNDWRYWGDVRLDVEHAAISTAGDVAWVTTLGTVGTGTSPGRAIRFTAVLTRHNGQWLFRHILFQWDDTPLKLSEQVKQSILGQGATP
jgi:ketosteroid isomerase-like protein